MEDQLLSVVNQTLQMSLILVVLGDSEYSVVFMNLRKHHIGVATLLVGKETGNAAFVVKHAFELFLAVSALKLPEILTQIRDLSGLAHLRH